MTKSLSHGAAYTQFLAAIKARIQAAKIAASRAVYKEMVDLYWSIGRDIVEKQEALGWGKAVVERLSKDLKKAFPDSRGYSSQNLWRMRQFFLEYHKDTILSQLAREIPWFSNMTILNKVKDRNAREYYLRATAELGWSRDILTHQIRANAYGRHRLSSKQHNFEETLPVHLAEQADKEMKDAYVLDFLGVTKPVLERELESRMVSAIKDVLLELRGIQKPVGVAEYRLTAKLPRNLAGKLPDAKTLRKKIMEELKD